MSEWIEVGPYSMHVDADGYVRRGMKNGDTEPCRIYRPCKAGRYDAVAYKPAYLKRLYKAGKVLIK